MLKKIFSTYVWRFGSMACNFFTIPLLLNRLGVDDYAVWATLTSLVAWLSLFDFGAGYSMRNRITEYVTLGKRKELADVVGGTITFFFFSASLALIAFTVCLFVLDIFRSYPVLALILYVPVICSLPALLGGLFYQALDKNPVLSFISFINTLVWLGFIACVSHSNYALVWMCIGYTVIHVGARLYIFYTGMRKMNIGFRGLLSLQKLRNTVDNLKSGLKFLILQITNLITFSLGNVLVYNQLSLSDVSQYDITNRVFMLIVSLYSAMLTIVWTRVSTYKATANTGQLLRLRRWMYVATAGICLAAFIGLPLIDWFIGVWSDHKLSAPYSIAIYFFASMSCQILAYAGCVFLNAFEKIWGQIVIAVIGALAFIPLSRILMHYDMGIVALPITVAATTLPAAIYAFFESRKCINNLKPENV